MEILSFVLGCISLVSTAVLAVISLPRKQRRLPTSLAIAGAAAGGGVLLLQGMGAIALTRDTKALITGGDAFGYVVPATAYEALPLMVCVDSDNALPGVAIRIIDINPAHAEPPFLPEIQVGTIAGHTCRQASMSFSPRLGPEGFSMYMVEVSAANGTVAEFLDIRRGHKKEPWAFSFTIAREVRLGGGLFRHDIPMVRGWSDEEPSGR